MAIVNIPPTATDMLLQAAEQYRRRSSEPSGTDPDADLLAEYGSLKRDLSRLKARYTEILDLLASPMRPSKVADAAMAVAKEKADRLYWEASRLRRMEQEGTPDEPGTERLTQALIEAGVLKRG